MSLRMHRTGLAFVLTLVAVAAPCGFWYVAGWRSAQQEAKSIAQEPERAARTTAQQLSERLRERLAALLKAEDKRPYYHYQNLIHDPNGAYEGVSVHPSPLADGPSDPYILAYFQISPDARLSLPTLNDEVEQADKNREEIEKQQAIRKQLEPAVAVCLSAFPSEPGSRVTGGDWKFDMRLAQSPAAPSPDAPTIKGDADSAKDNTSFVEDKKSSSDTVALDASLAKEKNSAPLAAAAAKPAEITSKKLVSSFKGTGGNSNLRSVQMKPEAYAQNQYANTVYLNNSNAKAPQKAAQRMREIPVKKTDVTIQIGPFQWITLPVGGKPTLAAVREVITPEGKLVQGFVISKANAEESFQGAAFPASFKLPSKPGAMDFSAPVSDTGWEITVNATAAWSRAQDQAANVIQTFLRFFFSGLAAALAAGFCIIGLVWQTERIARQRSQFAASAAHELRTPLAGMRMYGEMLAEGLGNPAKAGDYARRIASEAERLGRVISNVLGFTRLERGQLTVHPQMGDMAVAVREAVCRQQAALAMAGVKVELNIAEHALQVCFDPDALAVILQNLLDNAEKHTRAAANRKIEVLLKPCDGGVELSISDHGPGIPRAIRHRLFRPFVRGNQPDAPAGLGLGLAMAQALMRAHRGTLACTEAPGGGAIFTAHFPG